MKTADLIPFILLELKDGDKYGFELTKNIETKSNGRIVIKQPTLYTLLKKLEKSKFIASYWEDSDIGGKRHYYKLTQNGMLQVSTLPSYDDLMQKLFEEETSDEIINQNAEENLDVAEKPVSIMDALLESTTPTPAEQILSSDEVFINDLDSSTTLEINSANSEILKDEVTSSSENFAENENVKKFTEKVVLTPPVDTSIIKTDTSSQFATTILDVDYSAPKASEDIKFIDYQELRKNDQYIYSKSLTKKLLLKSILTSITLLVLAGLCAFITNFTGRSALYYFFLITSIVISIFTPIIFLSKFENIRLKYQNTNYENKSKLKLFICISYILIVLVACVAINLHLGNNSLPLMFGISNFENIYAPIIMSSICFIDILYQNILLSKIKK